MLKDNKTMEISARVHYDTAGIRRLVHQQWGQGAFLNQGWAILIF